MVGDATADYSDEEMHAALNVKLPNYATAIVSTEEIVASISALEDIGAQARGNGASTAVSKELEKGIHR